MVLLAKALHTLSDIFNSGYLLIALLWSRRRPTRCIRSATGAPRTRLRWWPRCCSFSFTSYTLFEESIPRLFRPEEPEYTHLWLALTVVLVSMVIAAVPLVALLRQKQRGASARAQLMELVNDQLGLARPALLFEVGLRERSMVVPPQVAIRCRPHRRARRDAQGRSCHAPCATLSLTFDPRVVTGGEAARFLVALKSDLERTS